MHSKSLLIKKLSLRTSTMSVNTFTIEVIFRNHFIRNPTTQDKKGNPMSILSGAIMNSLCHLSQFLKILYYAVLG